MPLLDTNLRTPSQLNGYEILANCQPLAIPFPRFNIIKLEEQRALFREALLEDRPFFLSLEEAEVYPGQEAFPLREMPLYIPRRDFLNIIGNELGDEEFMSPFYQAMLAREERIGVRKNPESPKVSNMEGHYLPMAVAGARLANVLDLPARDGEVGFDEKKFLPILGLKHDVVEDGIFTLTEIAEVKSPLTNNHLFDAVDTLTRQKQGEEATFSAKRALYQAYGQKIAGHKFAKLLVPMKWADISASCLQDLLNDCSMPVEYVLKQMTVLQAMGNTIMRAAGLRLAA